MSGSTRAVGKAVRRSGGLAVGMVLILTARPLAGLSVGAEARPVTGNDVSAAATENTASKLEANAHYQVDGDLLGFVMTKQADGTQKWILRSFARSALNARAVARFNRQLKALVNDPDSNATIDVGKISVSDFIGDLDLQYVFPQGRSVWTYLGLGVGVHGRNGTGRAINGTFVEDALDGVSPALNATLGVDVALAPHWRLTTELRGALLSDFSTASIQMGFAYRIGARQ